MFRTQEITFPIFYIQAQKFKQILYPNVGQEYLRREWLENLNAETLGEAVKQVTWPHSSCERNVFNSCWYNEESLPIMPKYFCFCFISPETTCGSNSIHELSMVFLTIVRQWGIFYNINNITPELYTHGFRWNMKFDADPLHC